MTSTFHTAASAAGIVVFIDSRVANWQALAAALPPGSEWHLVDGASDGLAQVAGALAGRSGLQAVHIVSHGAQGSMLLGASTLSAEVLPAHAGALAAIGAALEEDGDLLLYGCDTGAGRTGAALVDMLAALTGADVAASTDTTGAAASGGNWVLERSTGQVDAAPLDIPVDAWQGTLASSATFDFASGFVANTTRSGSVSSTAQQTVGAHVLTMTTDAGGLLVNDEGYYLGAPDNVLNGLGLLVHVDPDRPALPAPKKITLSLDGGKVFDLSVLSLLDLNGTLFDQNQLNGKIAITTDKGTVVVNVANYGVGNQIVLPNDPFLKGVSWVELSDPDNQTLLIQLDDIVLSNITRPPSFVAAASTLNLTQNGTASDLSTLLRASDTDTGETLTWTLSTAPVRGSVAITGATAASGGSSITPGGTLTYTPAAGFAGRETFVVRLTDGAASVFKTITADVAPQRPSAPNLTSATDTGSSSTDNLTSAASLAFTGTSASGDNSSTVRVFVDVNSNGVYDAGEATNTATLSNGSWSVSGISTTGLNGPYNVYALITASTGSLTSPLSLPLQVRIDRVAPTTTFSNILLSNDTGTSNTDLITSVAAQTITATLSQALAAGDRLEGSLNGGTSWTNLTAMASGTSLTWTGATLVAGGAIRLRVTDQAGNAITGPSQAYTLDQSAPTTTVASALFASDSGNDFILNASSQTLTGTLSANLATGERVEVSLNNGGSWSAASATTGTSSWSLAGITLSGSNTLRVRVVDAAGNQGGTYSRAYVLDQAAPTATTPGTTQLQACRYQLHGRGHLCRHRRHHPAAGLPVPASRSRSPMPTPAAPASTRRPLAPGTSALPHPAA